MDGKRINDKNMPSSTTSNTVSNSNPIGDLNDPRDLNQMVCFAIK